jgi:hypothetical protein
VHRIAAARLSRVPELLSGYGCFDTGTGYQLACVAASSSPPGGRGRRASRAAAVQLMLRTSGE